MMRNKPIQKTAAALLAVTLVSGAINVRLSGESLLASVKVNAAESVCSFDEATGTLTISGNLSGYSEQKALEKALKDYNEEKIVAEEGTVLPEYCSRIFAKTTAKSIDLSMADTSNVVYMDGMFEGSKDLESVNMSNYNTSKVTHMGQMFYNCTALSSLDISSFDTSNVKYMYRMFCNCKSLESLDLSSFDTSNVTEMNAMFEGCSSLESLELSHFKTSKADRLEDMFKNCTSLKELDISNFDTSNVTNLYCIFTNCKSLESLDLSSFDTSNFESMSDMFKGCSSLKSLNVSSFDTSKVTSMYSMFEGCSNIEKLDLSSFDTSSLSPNAARNMFKDCTALEPSMCIVKGNSVTLDGNIGVNVYLQPCENLAKAVMSGPNGDRVFTDFTGIIQDNGDYRFSYPINAAQGNEKITLKAYDKNGNRLLVCEDKVYGEEEYYGLCNHSQVECTVYGYIDLIKSTELYKNDGKLQILVNAMDNYCKAAENYFKGTENEVKEYSKDYEVTVEPFAPEFDEDVKISLVLDSATAVRIYTNASSVKIDNHDINSCTTKYGKCYEIANIPAYQLLGWHTLTIGDKNYQFSPMSYVYRVIKSGSASTELTNAAWAAFMYANAANSYIK